MTQDRWATITKSAAARKQTKQYGKSKYRDVIERLPSAPSEEDGYHPRCYSAFTAIQIDTKQDPKPGCSKGLRSTTPSPVAETEKSRVGIFDNKCLYCDKLWKTLRNGTKEGLGSVQTKDAENKIREAAKVLGDNTLLVKVSGIDLIAKEVKFHHSCRSKNLAAAARMKKTGQLSSKSQRTEKQAVVQILDYVKNNVILDSRPERLISVYDRYCLFAEEAEEEPTVSSAQYLGEILKKKFPTELQISVPVAKKQGSIVHSSLLDNKSIQLVYDFKSSDEGQLVTSALLLRKHLKDVKRTPLNDPLDVDSLMRGEGEPPKLADLFFRTLFSGRNGASEAVKRHAKSASQDALFSVHNGQLLTKKHILLGNLVHSMTGSRKLMTVLNRLGHCISYSKYEELETELATTIQSRQKCSPKGAKRGPVMGNAFDNYDELVHTLSGLDSLHDTMGIFYQSIDLLAEEIDDDQAQPPQPTEAGASTSRRKCKRKLDVPPVDIAPYRKRPRMETFDYANTEYSQLPDISDRARKLDSLFLLSHIDSQKTDVPMWGGFNARIHQDRLKKQVVHYMPNLNQPITKNEVVADTMRTALKCAEECGQTYGLVTYDLDVAKTAHKIQVTDQAEFNNLFIMFGVFHILMCLFRAIGKVIAESGGPAMLTDSGVLAPGSLNGFIECYSYNRCKRLHPMLALALEILLFRRFMVDYDNSDLILAELQNVQFEKKEDIDDICKSALFLQLFEAFEKFKEDAESGALGKTAQFWAMYIQYIQLYHLLERSVRETDIDLFITTMTQITDLFFATNRQNYARWMSKYQLDLMNMDDSHPGLRQILDKGGFSVRRSSNEFSRIPVDLTLEQTVNADAASRMTGYTSSTNNYSSRVRWSVTKSSRAALANEALSMVDMGNTRDTQTDLHPSRIKRDNSDLQKVISQIESCVNPFTLDPSLPLINISTGKNASDAVSTSLLNIPEEGKKRHESFVKECLDSAARFEKPIRKNPLRTFASECVANRKASKNSKEAQLKCTSELLGRLAFIAATNEIDLEYVFSFPLTPVPLSMCKGDGTMAHTDKSKLSEILESTVADHGTPTFVGTHIIDGNFQFHCMSPDQPVAYGELSRNILSTSLAYRSQKIHVDFDTYERPSIKDCERERREAVVGGELVIEGPQQKRDASFKKLLERESFKRELPVFLQKDWSNDFYKPILDGREVYLGVMGGCTRYFVEDGAVHAEPVPSLNCNHAEADTRVILHMIEADKSTTGDIVIRATDTDILVLILHHLHRVSSTVWMEAGTSGQGNLRYVNVTKIAAEIGPEMCAALPGLHAFTGCDYTSAFTKKGKKKPYELVRKSDNFQTAFASLSQTEPTEETVKVLQDFVCVLYGARKIVPLNKHRFTVVDRTYNRKANAARPFDKLKSISGSSIPPCEAELAPHIHRSAFVARLWGSAHQQNLEKMPTKGWETVDGEFRVIWFEGDQLPPALIPKIQVEKEPSDSTAAEGLVNYDDDEDHDPLPGEMESSDDDDDDDDWA